MWSQGVQINDALDGRHFTIDFGILQVFHYHTEVESNKLFSFRFLRLLGSFPHINTTGNNPEIERRDSLPLNGKAVR